MFEIFTQLRWQDALDIGLIAFVVYRLIHMIRGTRAMQMIIGLVVLLLIYVGSQMLGLFTLTWMLDNFLGSIILVVIVIFQSDIRRALTQVGTAPLFGGADRIERGQVLEEVAKAVVSLASRRVGALIVLEKEVGLNEYIEVGTRLDARVTRELLESVFMPHSPMHDGALVIQKGRATAARCFLPLSVDPNLSRALGTRHRAAVGLTEETDAVAIVISEEEGRISLVAEGKVTQDLDGPQMRSSLERLFGS